MYVYISQNVLIIVKCVLVSWLTAQNVDLDIIRMEPLKMEEPVLVCNVMHSAQRT